MLEARSLRKSFNGFAAIGGVSLTVPERGITAVIGPNGAGKSTLFNLLTGHLRADAGTVSLQGRDITAAAPHAICRMGVGRSFQHTNIFRKLTVFENVQAALIAHGGQARNFWGRAETLYRDEAHGAARLARSRRSGGTIGDSLSHGNQKQLELGIALASDPEAAAARRADRRHVGGRDARRDPPARTHRRRARADACCSPSTTWMWCSRSRRRSRCCIRAGSSPKARRPKCAPTRTCGASISGGAREPARSA